MPIKHFICDKTGQPVHFEACITCASSGKARKMLSCYHSEDVLRGIQSTLRGDMPTLSVTELLECPRALWFKKHKEYGAKPSKLYYAHRGNGFHAMMELGKQDGDIVEVRMQATVGGYPVSGKPDLIRGVVIFDHKSTKAIPKEVYEHHKIQVSCYRLLAQLQDKPLPIHTGEIIYMTMMEHAKMPVQLWSLEETEKWMTEKLKERYELLQKPEPPAFENHFNPKDWKCGRNEENSYCDVRSMCTQGQMTQEAPMSGRKVRQVA